MIKMLPMMRKTPITIIFLTTILALTGCESARDTLGLNKSSPDEFAVVKRAPLSMPPDYSLRPPQPGAPRPQEAEPSTAAKQTVFGSDAKPSANVHSSDPENALLGQIGAENANPDIRAIVDSETSADLDKDKPVGEKLLGIISSDGEPDASVVQPVKESERIKKNEEEGKPITDGDTPAVVE